MKRIYADGMKLMEKLKQGNLIDDDLKPQSLRTAYNKAMDMKKTSVVFDRIRNAMSI